MAKKKIPDSIKQNNSTLYAEEAHELLKILGKWVYLKSTSPSNYDEYHEVTRRWLENFKGK